MAKPAFEIKPQPVQQKFFSCPADIAFYGGAAGGGKTWSLCVEMLRHITNPEFRGLILRASYPEIMQSGGLLDETRKIYPYFGGTWRGARYVWEFPSGARVSLGYADEISIDKFLGSQFTVVAFDELTLFSQYTFDFIASRLRSMSGIKPYIRGTLNPKSDHWVRKMIDWYIGEDGFAIPERSGVLRYFKRRGDEIIWVDKDHIDENGFPPRSFSFIPAKVTDNPALLAINPEYPAQLNALPHYLRETLYMGNWNVTGESGTVFHRNNLPIRDDFQWQEARGGMAIRFWDFAATRKSGSDFTAGVLLLALPNGSFAVVDVIADKFDGSDIVELVRKTAARDAAILDQHGVEYMVGFEKEGGSSGVIVADLLAKALAGRNFKAVSHTTSKMARALPLAASVQAGQVFLLRGNWNDAFLSEMHHFPEYSHDDQVDAASAGFLAIAASTERLLYF